MFTTEHSKLKNLKGRKVFEVKHNLKKMGFYYLPNKSVKDVFKNIISKYAIKKYKETFVNSVGLLVVLEINGDVVEDIIII